MKKIIEILQAILLALKNQNVANLENRVATLESDVSSLETQLSNTVTALRTVEGKVATLEAKTNFPTMAVTETTKTISPNIYYVWGEVASLTITLADPSNNNIVNEYMFEFISGATATTLTLPAEVETEDIVIEANKKYQVDIVNNVAAIIGV